MSKLNKHVSPGAILGVVAIVIALTGTAIATVGSKSVGNRELKAFVVKKADFLVPADAPGNADHVDGAVQCGGNLRVFAGGVHVVNEPNTPNLQEFRILRSTRVGQGWGASIDNGESFPVLMRIQAICVRN